MKTTKTNVLSAAALGALLLVGAGCGQPAAAPAPAPELQAPAEDAVMKKEEPAPVPEEGAMMEKKTEDGAMMSDVKIFKVVAKSFEFEPAEIRVKMGDKVRLEVTSADSGSGDGHGLAIPAFGVNVKFEPGKPAVAEFVADKKGSYPLFCSVFCGSGHKDMKGTLIVE